MSTSLKSTTLTRWLKRALRHCLVLSIVVSLQFGTSQLAAAHAVGFTIWLFGQDQDSNVDNHYHVNPFCPGCPYDYMMPTYTTVYQAYSGAGTFTWQSLHMPAGVVFGSGTAFRGSNTWIYNSAGNPIFYADFNCSLITNQAHVYLAPGYYNNGPNGYWSQDSGYQNGSNCFTAYTVIDRMAIAATQ